MARYNAEILTIQVNYSDACERLIEMDDSTLIERLPVYMLEDHPALTPRSWRPDEPEFEALAGELRNQARSDLITAYYGDQDYRVDDRLAWANTRPYPTLILLTVANDDEDDYRDEDGEYTIANPVARLTSLGICRTDYIAPTPPLTITLNMDDEVQADQPVRMTDGEILDALLATDAEHLDVVEVPPLPRQLRRRTVTTTGGSITTTTSSNAALYGTTTAGLWTIGRSDDRDGRF